MRFSQPAISVDAQRALTTEIRRFLPAHPSEALLPLQVWKLPQKDHAWIEERLDEFTSYNNNPEKARRRMGKLFAVASAALASQSLLTDDKLTHEVVAFIPSTDAFPTRLLVELHSMATDDGWTRSRGVDVWVVNSPTIVNVRYNFRAKVVSAELQADPRSQPTLRGAIFRYGRLNKQERTATVRICVRLTRPQAGTDPIFEALANENLFSSLNPASPALANIILDSVYGGRPRNPRPVPAPPSLNMSVTVASRRVQLCNDQAQALLMADERRPLQVVQAAYGTGETLIGALIAARLASPGDLVLVTATTNVAVAQFTKTLSSLDEYRHLPILRFVADKALQEGAPVTAVDLHTVLQGLVANYSESLSSHDRRHLERYARGRRLIETMLFHPEHTFHLTDEEREKYKIAEIRNSEATERAVRIMLHLQFPAILCMTTSSLLNSTRPGGLFHDLLSCCRTIIADEASQIPESVFVAMTVRFPQARHIYIGDVHQLQPHLRCPRSTLAARLGARGVMDLLHSKDVPLTPLVTTFRAHPALNQLPNMLVYSGSLVSGTPADRRSRLIQRISLPNPRIPFVLANVRGRSRTSYSFSHYNEEEALCCQNIIRGLFSRNVPSSAIGVITFYKEQSSRLREYANKQGVALHTIDSVQGKELDVVIILTTRTHVDPSTGEFLSDITRLNVALTRCKYGQFVLGYLENLGTLPHWNRIIQWASHNNLVVDTSELEDIFA